MYRVSQRKCPSCAESMECRNVGTSDAANVEIDVCPKCQGIFLDFDDGEPSNVARAVTRGFVHEPASPIVAIEPTCPDCKCNMQWQDYLQEGPQVARCGECGSLFVPEMNLRQLARAGMPTASPKEVDGFIGWRRILKWILEGEGEIR